MQRVVIKHKAKIESLLLIRSLQTRMLITYPYFVGLSIKNK